MTEATPVYRIHYRGTYDDGTVFADTYDTDEPIDIIPGESGFPAAFEEAVVRLKPGETVEISIPAAQAYGFYDEALIKHFLRREVPGMFPGMRGLDIYLAPEKGQPIQKGKIVEVGLEELIVDFNHPMAGCNLNYGIDLLEVV